MEALSTLTDIRDIVVIVVGILSVLAIFIFIIFTVLIGFTSWRLIRAARGTVKDGVPPILENAQETVRTVQGTVAFVGDSFVRPIIRVYGVFAGIRKAVGVLGRSSGRGD